MFYPKLVTPDLYRAYQSQKPSAGYGALFSITFRVPEHASVFYDALRVAKGPGFGTNFTLVCPYTQLAHFTELDQVITYYYYCYCYFTIFERVF